MGEVKAVADMHQRKAEMSKHSDAFIALPGQFHSTIIPSLNYKFFIYKILSQFTKVNMIKLDVTINI